MNRRSFFFSGSILLPISMNVTGKDRDVYQYARDLVANIVTTPRDKGERSLAMSKNKSGVSCIICGSVLDYYESKYIAPDGTVLCVWTTNRQFAYGHEKLIGGHWASVCHWASPLLIPYHGNFYYYTDG